MNLHIKLMYTSADVV